jgi:hypothetical protein
MPELRQVTVRDWGDIDSAPMLTGPEKDAVATVFQETEHDSLVLVPEFKLNEDDHDVVRATDDEALSVEADFGRLAVGYWENYSDGAIRFTQFHRKNDPTINGTNWGCYIPKSTTVVLDAADALGDLDSPQEGLDAFADGGRPLGFDTPDEHGSIQYGGRNA